MEFETKIFKKEIPKVYRVRQIKKKDKFKKIYIPLGPYEKVLKILHNTLSTHYIIYLKYVETNCTDFAISSVHSGQKFLQLFHILQDDRRFFKVDVINYFESITPDRLDLYKYVLPKKLYETYDVALDDSINFIAKVNKLQLGMDIDRFIDVIKTYCFINGHIPYGLPTSPILAGILTTGLTYRLNVITKAYNRSLSMVTFRYADDFLIGVQSSLSDEKIINYIKSVFGRYKFKIRITPIRKNEEFKFLGLYFVKTDDKVMLKLPRSLSKKAAVFLDKERDHNKKNGYYGYINPILWAAKSAGVELYGRHTIHLYDRFFENAEINKPDINIAIIQYKYKDDLRNLIKKLYNKGFRLLGSTTEYIALYRKISALLEKLNPKTQKIILTPRNISGFVQILVFRHSKYPDKVLILCTNAN